MILLAAGRLTRPDTIDDRRKARPPASGEVRISSGECGEGPKEARRTAWGWQAARRPVPALTAGGQVCEKMRLWNRLTRAVNFSLRIPRF